MKCEAWEAAGAREIWGGGAGVKCEAWGGGAGVKCESWEAAGAREM